MGRMESSEGGGKWDNSNSIIDKYILKNEVLALAGVAQWIVSAFEAKGCQFDSQSGHRPGLQAKSLVGGTQEATTFCCFSPSLLFPLKK